MWHPASLLLTWLGFALLLQWVAPHWLALLALVAVLLSLFVAGERSRNLLRRSRWLLLSLLLLFLFATPGEYLPGIWGRLGLTYEGLRQGGEQLSRLLAMLSSLAVLHQQLGTQGLLTGFHWLLAPFPWCRATVVRLFLVIEFVEQRGRLGWREWLAPEAEPAVAPDCFVLAIPALHARDRLLIACLLAALTMSVIWP
jgi:energy-coupling factor transport system permease protein